jgi:cytochrome P450
VSAMPLLPRFAALSPDAMADPYPIYEALRERSPICRAGPGQYAVTRYDDVSRLLRDGRLSKRFPRDMLEFSNGRGPAIDLRRRLAGSASDDRLRRHRARRLRPAVVADLDPYIRATVDHLLTAALDGEAIDAVRDVAVPLSLLVIARLTGVRGVEVQEFFRRRHELSLAFGAVPEEHRAAADDALLWLRDHVAARCDGASPRSRPPTSPGDASHEGFTRDELVDDLVFFFFAGVETTAALLAAGFVALCEHPDLFSRLRHDRTLVDKTVEELLRYDPPIQATTRFVREPILIAGHKMREGRVVNLLIGSANRDDAHFQDPASFDVTRATDAHLTFGGGRHLCLGAGLARREAAITLERLLDRCRGVAPAEPVVRRPHMNFRSFESVPLTVTPR